MLGDPWVRPQTPELPVTLGWNAVYQLGFSWGPADASVSPYPREGLGQLLPATLTGSSFWEHTCLFSNGLRTPGVRLCLHCGGCGSLTTWTSTFIYLFLNNADCIAPLLAAQPRGLWDAMCYELHICPQLRIPWPSLLPTMPHSECSFLPLDGAVVCMFVYPHDS